MDGYVDDRWVVIYSTVDDRQRCVSRVDGGIEIGEWVDVGMYRQKWK